MPDPNLRLLEEAAKKLAPFLGEIVFIGGVTLGLLITDKAAAPIPQYGRRGCDRRNPYLCRLHCVFDASSQGRIHRRHERGATYVPLVSWKAEAGCIGAQQRNSGLYQHLVRERTESCSLICFA